jgi:hypothetical protein
MELLTLTHYCVTTICLKLKLYILTNDDFIILQMNPINKYLNSREYKVMLKKDLFKDKGEGIKKVISILKTQVEGQGGTFNSDVPDEDKSKKVWYLDTKNHKLYENTGLLIRVKENQETSEFKVEFKIRNSDRNKAASYDLYNPKKNSDYDFKRKQYKFEEDITTPFNGVFSVSSVFEYKKKPTLNSFKDIESIYPSLGIDLLDKNKKIEKVNDFEAEEFNPDLGEIIFENGKSAQIQLSIWYSPEDNSSPCIVEFDLDVDAEKPSNDNDDKFEEFPQSKMAKIDKLYKNLQGESIDIADLKASKTKTRFVYEWKHDM